MRDSVHSERKVTTPEAYHGSGLAGRCPRCGRAAQFHDFELGTAGVGTMVDAVSEACCGLVAIAKIKVDGSRVEEQIDWMEVS